MEGKMDEPHSSTKTGESDVDSTAPVPASLPAGLGTSPTNPPLVQPLMVTSDTNPPPTSAALGFTIEEEIMVVAGDLSKSSNSAKNIVELNSNILATICGGSEYLLQELRDRCVHHEETVGSKPLVTKVLEWLSEIRWANKKELQVEILIAGCNEKERGLYFMNKQGDLLKDNYVVIGSSSISAEQLKDRLLFRQGQGNVSASRGAYVAAITYCSATYKVPRHVNDFCVYHLGNGGCKKVTECDVESMMALR